MNKKGMLKWVRVDEFDEFNRDLDQFEQHIKEECAKKWIKIMKDALISEKEIAKAIKEVK